MAAEEHSGGLCGLLRSCSRIVGMAQKANGPVFDSDDIGNFVVCRHSSASSCSLELCSFVELHLVVRESCLDAKLLQ